MGTAMKTKLTGTTHSGYFDRDEPAILRAIEDSPFVKKLVGGSYESTRSSRRRLKLQATVLNGKVEAVYDGYLNLAGMARCLRIYTTANISLGDLHSDLSPQLNRYGVAVHIKEDKESIDMQDQNNNGHFSSSREEMLTHGEVVYSYMEIVHQFKAEVEELRARLESSAGQLEEAEDAVIEVLEKFFK